MNSKEFDEIVDKVCEDIKSILCSKAKEYANEEDDNRLWNFEVAARLNNTTKEKALWGMYTKHLVSVMDLVNNPDKVTEYLIQEKLIDSINYHILLKAVLTENLKSKYKHYE